MRLAIHTVAIESSRVRPSRVLALLAGVAVLALPAAAQLQFEELAKRGLPPHEETTRASAIGDLDGDGDLDLIAGNYNGQPRLYRNDGSAIFTDATAIQMPVDQMGTTSLALGDVDGDGDLDLVIGSHFGQNRLYLNDGAATFTDVTAARLPANTYDTSSVALGDMDGDGDLDLVLVLPVTFRNVCLYLNNGTGMFLDATTTHLPAQNTDAKSLVLGDVDRDGDLDVVAARLGRCLLYLNNGSATLTDASVTHMPPNGNASCLAQGDVDGDGDLDLAVGDSQGYSSSRTSLFLNNGSGVFTNVTAARLPVTNFYTLALAFEDVDGDSDLDLVLGNWTQQSRLYRNDGTGTFTDATANHLPIGRFDTLSLSLGDLDQDGDPDLVVGNEWQQDFLWLNDGAGVFADATAARRPVGKHDTTSLAFGDVDRDGDLDLVLGNSWLQSRLYLNSGTGSFTDATASNLPAGTFLYTTALALGDLDGDGDADLVLGNNGVPSRQYRNNGMGLFTDATAGRMPTGSHNTTALALGDVDGDGDLDLVVGNQFQQNRLYLNHRTGQFTDVTTSCMPVGTYDTRALALGDVDGDGDVDLVVGNQFQSRLYLNSGRGTFTDVTAVRMPAVFYNTRALALGDLDQDADLDLVLGNDGPSRVFLNNGAGFFADTPATHLPGIGSWATSVALGDLDGDCDLDLVLGSSNMQNRLFMNNGNATFSEVTAARLPSGVYRTRALALGDVDRDGDLDLFVGNHGSGNGHGEQSYLLQNLNRQLDAPFVLQIGRNYRLDVYSRYGPPGGCEVAFPFVSTVTANIPLPPLGVLGIDPAHAVALWPFAVPQPAGIGSRIIAIPNVPAMAGVMNYWQVLVMQQLGSLRLTNIIDDFKLK